VIIFGGTATQRLILPVPVSLQVNFDESTVMLFKEVRNLTWLGFRVPMAIRHLSDQASERYPYAMALQSTLRTYTQTRQHITADAEPLLMSHLKAIRDVVTEAFTTTKGRKWVKWDSPDLSTWVTAFSERVFTLQVRMLTVMGMVSW
jgi:hypothetical protein